jgi:hypothetical protein
VFDQVWARNKTRAERGRVELCGENPSRHDQELPRLSIPYETMIIASQPSVFQSPRFVNRTVPGIRSRGGKRGVGQPGRAHPGKVNLRGGPYQLMENPVCGVERCPRN